MQVRMGQHGAVTVTSGSHVSDCLLLAAAAACAIPTIRGAMHGYFDFHESTPLIGTAFFMIGWLASFERSRFEFNPASGCIRWSRRRLVSTQRGTLQFSEVKSVVLQSSVGSSATAPGYRLALISDGGELPLGNAYVRGARKEWEILAAMIRSVLGIAAGSDTSIESVNAALQRGDKLGAIRLARLQTGLSLVEAKREVEVRATPVRESFRP